MELLGRVLSVRALVGTFGRAELAVREVGFVMARESPEEVWPVGGALLARRLLVRVSGGMTLWNEVRQWSESGSGAWYEEFKGWQ